MENKYPCLHFSIADKSKKVRTCYSCSDPESQPESEPNCVSGTFIGLNTMVCLMFCRKCVKFMGIPFIFVYLPCVRGGEDSGSDGAQTEEALLPFLPFTISTQQDQETANQT